MLPQTNARLVSISTDGSSEDWDQPVGAAGAPKWQGDSDAYVQEKVRTVFSDREGALKKFRDVTVIIPSAVAAGGSQGTLVVQTGDIVTYIFRGIQHTRRVMDYSAPYLPNMNVPQYVKLHMNPEPVETALESN